MEPLPERLQGQGLELRRWTRDTVAAMHALIAANVEHLRPYMVWIAEEPKSLEARRELEATWEREWAAGGTTVYGIFEDGVAVGSAGLHDRIGPGGWEIGYWVAHDHLGRGIAGRASALLTAAAFARDDVDRVEIHHDLTNVHSRRVPEQLGFHHVGEVRPDRALAPDECGVELVWRVTRDEWLSRGTA